MPSINDLEKEWSTISKNPDINDLDNYQKFVDKFKTEHLKWKDLQKDYEKILHSENDKKDETENTNTIGEFSIFLNEIKNNIQSSIDTNESNPEEIIEYWKVYKEAYHQLTRLLQKKSINISHYNIET
tara:strand:- start:365 stop:748 length:384 start_codon:yes stop_codon:yes gene_type:complete